MSHSFDTLSRPLVGVYSSVVHKFSSLSFSSLLVNHPYLYNAVRLLLAGPIIETARRLFQWVVERFRFRMSLDWSPFCTCDVTSTTRLLNFSTVSRG